ncbi:MAG: anaerobic sulfatase maturase [Armatimonadota bacterium]|nr:anaerobic sulfatase maturase [bacterium]
MASKPFSLLIKPASADCNLRCAYCFYLSKSALYPEASRHRMEDDVLERLISSYMATDQPVYAFGWQGGEPTLMGVEFFRKVTEFQQKYGRSGAVVSNGLQTNATLMNDELAEHLAEYNFLVGVSLDGPADIHNHHRVTVDGRGSHDAVLRGIECLERNKVEYNVLVLVNSANVERGREVYRYLCDLGILYHQYIPCVEFDDNGCLMPYSVSGESWGRFMCDIFDEWQVSDCRRVSVRAFDSIIAYLVDGTRNVCTMQGNCSSYFLVEHNGDIYPCDFFVEPDKKLGNVMVDDWPALQQSEKYKAFACQKSKWNPVCSECDYLQLCLGDCLKHRTPDSKELSTLCVGTKLFLEHALPRFKSLAAEVREQIRQDQLARERAVQSAQTSGKIGRNDLCPCGSGLKYKKCHGAK